MHDADARGHNLELVERLHPPFQKFVTLAVTLEFDFEIALECVRRAVHVHLHRVVHHQIHRHKRFDDFRIFSHARDGGAHRRQIHKQRHACKILQNNARHDKWNFFRAFRVRSPVGQCADVLFRDFFGVAIAQHGFEHESN